MYWNATNTYRYFHGKSRSVALDVLNADRIITDEGTGTEEDKRIVIDKIPLSIMTNRKISLSEQYAYDKELFVVIEQLILGEDK